VYYFTVANEANLKEAIKKSMILFQQDAEEICLAKRLHYSQHISQQSIAYFNLHTSNNDFILGVVLFPVGSLTIITIKCDPYPLNLGIKNRHVKSALVLLAIDMPIFFYFQNCHEI
jgi:hypothetical protein